MPCRRSSVAGTEKMSLADSFTIKPTTALWQGEPGHRQVLWVHWDNLPATFGLVASPGGNDKWSDRVEVDPRGKPWGDLLLGVPVPENVLPGQRYPVIITIDCLGKIDELKIEAICPEGDWVCFIGAGYHADPVWWNTQRDYTEVGRLQGSGVGSFIDLNRLYLSLLETDPDFACTIETVPVLHPTWLSDPECRNTIRKLIRERRLELIASYDEPQSTLVGCELLCRNIAYGAGFGRLISGVTPKGLAQWDVFGHDPIWPALGRAAGLEWTTFCRGLYHGGCLPPDENCIPTEFRWVSPDGSELMTHYMSRHYTSGWEFSWASREEGELGVLKRFDQLTIPAPTHNVLFPCYGDFAEPFEGMMDLVRWWNEKYLSPQLVVGTQDDYLTAVRESCESKRIWLPPISRDLNPAFSGCNLSFAETKQAQRLIESIIRDAEVWATCANLYGAAYPIAALDRAWRILNFNAHHDAVTGSESDQVYLDLTALYREAHDLASEVRDRSMKAIARITRSPDGNGDKIVGVFNSLGRSRGGTVAIPKEELPEDTHWSAVDDSGEAVPLVQHADGWEFKSREVPALGWKTYRLIEEVKSPQAIGHSEPCTIENNHFIVRVDPPRGGGIESIVDKQTGKEFVTSGEIANDIVVYPEYPGLEMGPWCIQPTGERIFASEKPARVVREISHGVQAITSEVEFLGCIVERRITLYKGEQFLDCVTSIRGFSDHDLLWRAEFPMHLPGTRPVAQTSGGVIGRPFGRLGDFQDIEYFGDFAIDTWGGLECPLAFRLNVNGRSIDRTVAVGEIVITDSPDAEIQDAVDRLVPLLARVGVTTVVTRSGSRRAGDWSKDGSRPDFRIVLGSPQSNAFLKEVLEQANESDPETLSKWLSNGRPGACWIDLANHDIGFDQPIIVLPAKRDNLRSVLDQWEKAAPGSPAMFGSIHHAVLSPDYADSGAYSTFHSGCAIIVHGTPGMQVLPDGTIALGWFRSSSGCPSGGWIDDSPRRMPDGSFFQHEHWTHSFEYRVMPHVGDWRDAGVALAAEDFTQPLEAVVCKPSTGKLPSTGSFLSLETGGTTLQALRPLEMPETSFDHGDKPVEVSSGILVRLREINGRATEFSLPDERVLNVKPVDLLGSAIQTETDDENHPGRFKLDPWSLRTFAVHANLGSNKPLAGTSIDDELKPRELWPARYWRSSLGPAGWRAQPVFHKFVETSLDLKPNEKLTVKLQVVSNVQRPISSVKIAFQCPDFIDLDKHNYGPFDLESEQVIEVPIDIAVENEIPDEGGFLSAILTMPDGVRTLAAVPVNRRVNQPLPLELELPQAVIVGKDSTELVVSIGNTLPQVVEGMLELILPFEAWTLIPADSVRREVVLPPGETIDIKFPLKRCASVEPGRYFALAKLHCLEEQIYSESCWVIVPDKNGIWVNCDQGRCFPFGRPNASLGLTFYTENETKPALHTSQSLEDLKLDLSQTSEQIPGGTRTQFSVDLNLKSDPQPDSNFTMIVEAAGTERKFERSIRFPRGQRTEVRRLEKSPGLEDSVEQWIDALDYHSQRLSFVDANANRDNRKLDLPVWIGHDSDALYIMVETDWEVRLNPHRKRNIRLGDCLQLAFFPSRLVEIGFALTFDGPVSWTWHVVMGSPHPPLAQVRIDRASGTTRFRTRIPWHLIRLENPPALLPWNVVLQTTSSDNRWAGAWQLGDGTVFKKTADGTEFGLLTMGNL